MPANLTFMQKLSFTGAYVQQFAPYNYTTKLGQGVRDMSKAYSDSSFKFAGQRFTKRSAWMKQVNRKNQGRRENTVMNYKDYRFWLNRYHQENLGFLGDSQSSAQNEWQLYMQPDTLFDRRVRELLGERSITFIFIKDSNPVKLKRIEADDNSMDDGHEKPDVIWLRA